jgi:hypothetical protein
MSFDEGYRAGSTGCAKAIETAETLGALREQKRIIELIKPFAQCDECDAGGKADDCSPKLAQYIIDLIKKVDK